MEHCKEVKLFMRSIEKRSKIGKWCIPDGCIEPLLKGDPETYITFVSKIMVARLNTMLHYEMGIIIKSKRYDRWPAIMQRAVSHIQDMSLTDREFNRLSEDLQSKITQGTEADLRTLDIFINECDCKMMNLRTIQKKQQVPKQNLINKEVIHKLFISAVRECYKQLTEVKFVTEEDALDMTDAERIEKFNLIRDNWAVGISLMVTSIVQEIDIIFKQYNTYDGERHHTWVSSLVKLLLDEWSILCSSVTIPIRHSTPLHPGMDPRLNEAILSVICERRTFAKSILAIPEKLEDYLFSHEVATMIGHLNFLFQPDRISLKCNKCEAVWRHDDIQLSRGDMIKEFQNKGVLVATNELNVICNDCFKKAFGVNLKVSVD